MVDVGVARVGAALGVALLAFALIASTAHGKGEYELNDSRAEAYGPLAGEKWYTASIETDNDPDWYIIYITSYSQMSFEAEILKQVSCNVVVDLRDQHGEYIDSFATGDLNQVGRLSLTVDAGKYYLVANESGYCPAGNRYKFKISPAASLTTSKDCGEAILAKEDVQPELDKVGDLLDNNDDSLAKVDEVIGKQRSQLVGLIRHWRKLKLRWQRNARRIARSTRPGYVKRRSWRRLRLSKRRAHRRIAGKMREPRARMAKANETREKVMETRAKLEALDGQYGDVVEDAEETIKNHC